MDVSEKTPYEKFSEMGTKVITVFQYYDYAVFKIEEENGIKVPKEVEIAEPILKFGALTKSYKTVEDELVDIRAYLSKNTIADVVLTTIFQMFMKQEGYDQLRDMFSKNLTDEEINLHIFKTNMYSEAIIVRGTFPIVFKERVENYKHTC